MATAVFPHWHGANALRRRAVQLALLAVFVALPAADLFRFDFLAGRLYLFRQEIWLEEWALLWLALMFAMWLVGALSLLFGRVYCGYACPQMVFTELAHDLDAVGRRLARRLAPPWRNRLARAVSLSLVALLSVAASAFFMGYFAPLPEVFRRLGRADVGLWVGLIGATTAALTFLDLAFVRERFCRTVCPYGLLQGILEDGRSLHVAFDTSSGPCIECKACVRQCPMEIDIRAGAFQIECTRCGTCIDACDEILARLKRPGLLSFRLPGFGAGGFDAKRALVAVATVGFGVALVVAVLARETFAVQVSPVFADRPASAEQVEARALLRATNRTSEPITLSLRLDGLPASAAVEGLEDGVVPPRSERRFELVVRLPATQAEEGLTRFDWVVAGPAGEERFPAGLLATGRRPT